MNTGIFFSLENLHVLCFACWIRRNEFNGSENREKIGDYIEKSPMLLGRTSAGMLSTDSLPIKTNRKTPKHFTYEPNIKKRDIVSGFREIKNVFHEDRSFKS